MNPIDKFKKLEQLINQILEDVGVSLEQLSLSITPDGLLSFRANLDPQILIKHDIDIDEIEALFNDIISKEDWTND